MVVFNSYVKLPEGNHFDGIGTSWNIFILVMIFPKLRCDSAIFLSHDTLAQLGEDVVLQSVEVSFEGDGVMVRVKDIQINGRFDVRGWAGLERCYEPCFFCFWAE